LPWAAVSACKLKPWAVARRCAGLCGNASGSGQVNLTTLPLGQYGTGSAPNVKTLKDFVLALSRTVGHYRGEGHCHSHAR
jgi:hypothetical protein